MTGLVLVAAGSGQRLAAGIPKALVEVGGQTLIGHCLTTAGQVDRIEDIVVVVPPAEVPWLTAEVAGRGATVVAGGDTRDASVRAGLAALPAHTRFVLVHDAARPFVPAEVFDRVLDALSAGAEAVVPAVPVADTIKRVEEGVVRETLPRGQLVAVQTPQGFRFSTLLGAHGAGSDDVTDDAARVEQAGVTVHVVMGSSHSFKITTQFDLLVARALQEES